MNISAIVFITLLKSLETHLLRKEFSLMMVQLDLKSDFIKWLLSKKNEQLDEDEILEFRELIKERRIRRFEIVESEIKKTGINSIDKFKKDYPNIFGEIYSQVLLFEDEVLSYDVKTRIPVYWDFRTFLHIYLRHCVELQLGNTFEGKTPFSYNKKDIRKLLLIAIKQLDPRIQEKLSQGLDFRVYGEKALYFNGNYYSLRIEPSGRLDSFYPNEHLIE